MNHVDELKFLVMVEGASGDRVVAALQGLDGAESGEYGRIVLRGNHVDVRENDDADPVRAAAGEDDFLYFAWEVQVMPVIGPNVTWESQIALARLIRDGLIAEDLRVEVLASFEDEV
ncbi:hypothetical protein [Allokutzneria sp. NRRL B-24872]|uniref:hypothetical protein n=1 Tax=Allokutzneria sp. NRRL B-24872 TaxID=1137961 RepID=UPI00143CFA39|nr:hypothetical protein [Allokutzneria sp. NRRL B-24872]